LKDFTLEVYDLLLRSLDEKAFSFCTFEEFIKTGYQDYLVLRHDVDRKPGRAVRMAELEYGRSVRASYHFRVPQQASATNEEAIKKIAALGHEIAYHYEDYSRVMKNEREAGKGTYSAGDHENIILKAEKSFKHNLQYLRHFYPVRVISMHGDPLSTYDNRDLWRYLNYSDYGIICEPYLDIDYSAVLYLTDTGRRWDAIHSNKRDRIPDRTAEKKTWPGKLPKTTFQVIEGINSGDFGKSLVLNTHPQRWSENQWEWFVEIITQNIKNLAKSVLFR
jgi:hypothetical protein